MFTPARAELSAALRVNFPSARGIHSRRDAPGSRRTVHHGADRAERIGCVPAEYQFRGDDEAHGRAVPERERPLRAYSADPEPSAVRRVPEAAQCEPMRRSRT